MKASIEADRFIGLDGLRGIAAIAVLSLHVPGAPFARYLPSSYLAVDLFFLLSGFVLSHAYAQRLAGGMSPLDFMKLRLVRLYPLYVLGTLIMLAVVAIQFFRWRAFDPATFGTTLLTALLFLPTPPQFSLNRDVLYPLNFPAWSLFFELEINMVFAALAPHLDRRTLAMALAVGLALLLVTILAFGELKVGPAYESWLGGFGRVTFAFFAGVALHSVWRSRRLAWMKLPSWVPMPLLLGVLAAPVEGLHRMMFDFVACVVIFPAIVLASANSPPAGRLERACVLMGAASYAVYVLQVPIIYAIDALLNFTMDISLKSFGEEATLTVALIVFFAAYFADRYYDAPVRRWLSARIVPRRSKDPVAAEIGERAGAAP